MAIRLARKAAIKIGAADVYAVLRHRAPPSAASKSMVAGFFCLAFLTLGLGLFWRRRADLERRAIKGTAEGSWGVMVRRERSEGSATAGQQKESENASSRERLWVRPL